MNGRTATTSAYQSPECPWMPRPEIVVPLVDPFVLPVGKGFQKLEFGNKSDGTYKEILLIDPEQSRLMDIYCNQARGLA